jgi:predicted phosphodiesterase
MKYAIISDIHGNLVAFEAVIRDIEKRLKSPVIFLGDAVGYYSQSADVVKRLQSLVTKQECSFCEKKKVDTADTAYLWVAGNHERGMIKKDQENDARNDALETWDLTYNQLPEEQLAFLEKLPDCIEVSLGVSSDNSDEISVTLVHASPERNEYTRGYLNNTGEAQNAGNTFTTSVCLVGHTHVPRIFREKKRLRLWEEFTIGFGHPYEEAFTFGDERVILNPGSVGQPRNGYKEASYGILDTESRTFTVHLVSYDIRETQNRLLQWLKTSLPEEKVQRLCYGEAGRTAVGLANRLELGL